MRKLLLIFAFIVAGLIFLGTKSDQTGYQVISSEETIIPLSPGLSDTVSLNINRAFGRIPLYFIENKGQVDEAVKYYVEGKDKTIYFTPRGLTYLLKSDNSRGTESYRQWVVKLEFVGARENAKPKGLKKMAAKISYFKGRPEQWKTSLSTYSRIVYGELWPGIDLVYYGTRDRLKYEFIVSPGADPSQIKLAYSGISSLELNGRGLLEIKTSLGKIVDEEPVGYQVIDGNKKNIELAYALEGGIESKVKSLKTCQYGFKVGKYNQNLPLVIDPAILVYCGYIGGSQDDYGRGIAVDGDGNTYIIGETLSDEISFPVSVGPSLIKNEYFDVFVAKMNSSGTALIYCGYIGGASSEYIAANPAIDDSGNVFIVGYTGTSEIEGFPVIGGPDLTHNGCWDVFVAKVNSTGTSLDYCGFIGGGFYDWGKGIAVDASGNAYVAGFTHSSENEGFPVTGGPDLTYNGGDEDAFVAKINPTGTALIFCGFIGGLGADRGTGIAIDESGNSYISGNTSSTEFSFPEIGGPDLTYNGGDYDAFVAKVDSSGSSLIFCGYIGGSDTDQAKRIAIDSSGATYVTGFTYSDEATFPVLVGPDLTYNGGGDVYVAKVNSSGSGFVYCGYIGGSHHERSISAAVDSSGNAYITGHTESTQYTFPVHGGPDLTYNGMKDAFVAKVNASGNSMDYCGYIGGNRDDFGQGIAVDSTGNAYVTGYTYSTESTFPLFGGPDLTFNGGMYDAFVAKVVDCTITSDIRANGYEGPINIIQSDTLQVRISLNVDYTNANVDYWLTYKGPSGWVHYNNANKKWESGLGVTHQGPLMDLNNKKVFQKSGLATGTYIFYFGVDMNMDGKVTKSSLYKDEVKVTVTQ